MTNQTNNNNEPKQSYSQKVFRDIDLFIAFYLDENGGSQDDAHTLYCALKKIVPTLQIYFYPESNPSGGFTSTPGIIRDRAKAFLFVVNKNLPREANGEMRMYNRYDEKRRLFEELAEANNGYFRKKNIDDTQPSKIFVADGDNELLHNSTRLFADGSFSGNMAFDGTISRTNNYQDVIRWLTNVQAAYENSLEKSQTSGGLYWVGTRQSDIEDCEDGFFAGSITLFGNGSGGNRAYCSCANGRRIDHNVRNDDADFFIYEEIKKTAEEDPGARFYCYNPGIAYGIRDEKGNNLLAPYLDRFVCLNSEQVMSDLKDKKFFIEHVVNDINDVKPIDKVYCNARECSRENIITKFIEQHGYTRDMLKKVRFIVQAPVASGGSGTFILNGKKDNDEAVKRELDQKNNTVYICSVYRENNVPVNVHAIIFDDFVAMSTPSIQLMCESNRRLMYRGADFIEYRRLQTEWKERLGVDLSARFVEKSARVAEKLRKLGYRGVCGIDGIITRDEVTILEVNNRFQASTSLLNLALKNIGAYSVQKLNLAAFDLKRKSVPEKAELAEMLKHFAEVEVNYANFSYIANGATHQAYYLDGLRDDKRILQENGIVRFEPDGFSGMAQTTTPYESDAYLYRIVFNTNISWINEEFGLYFGINIVDESERVRDSILSEYDEDAEARKIYLKTALMMQGVNFEKSLFDVLTDKHKLHPATNQAVDIMFCSDKFDKFVVNAPVTAPVNYDEEKGSGSGVKFTGLTPFLIKAENDGLELSYYGEKIDNIALFPLDEIAEGGNNVGLDGVPYLDIAYLSTDRLRVHLTNACIFKRENKGCSFCGIKIGDCSACADDRTFSDENIERVIRAYLNCYPQEKKVEGTDFYALRHFLIGGQSADVNNPRVDERLCSIIKVIHKATSGARPIYAMVLPCDHATIDKLHVSGLSEIAFNIEIADDLLARRYMEGKGAISREYYYSQLTYASQIFDKEETVRSMLLVGLEPLSNTLGAVEKLVNIGVQPMLSVFRPMPGTPLENFMTPSVEKVVELYYAASEACKQKRMHLGPHCKCCQNNTVSLPYDIE